MCLESDTANKAPYGWRVRTSLTGTVDRELDAMLVEGVGYTRRFLQFELGFFQSGSMNENNVFMDSIFSTGKACYTTHDSIIACGGIIIEIIERESCYA